MSPYHSTYVPLNRQIEAKDATTILFILNEVLRTTMLLKHLDARQRDFIVKKYRKLLINEERAGTLALSTTNFSDSKIWWEHKEPNAIYLRDVGELEQMGIIRQEHAHNGLEVIE